MSDEGGAREREEANSFEEASSQEGTASHEAAAERPKNLAYEQARLAYTIIQALLEHTRVTQDLVALMAQALGEDVQEALVNTPHWAAYMDSRRTMERTREDVEKFAAEWTRLAEELEPPATS
jgi:L-ascorbate metabolism protein UlaG (beta-lactamase superfamily)